MEKVLLIASGQAYVRNIETKLRGEGMYVETCLTGEAGLAHAELLPYEIIVLDFDLTDITGLEILRRLRGAKIQVPVICISGALQTEEKIRALECGAVEYLVQPINLDELVAIIRAITRRLGHGHLKTIIQIDDLLIDLRKWDAAVNGKWMGLTELEFHLLRVLAQNAGKTLSQEDICSKISEDGKKMSKSSVPVYIMNLRKKMLAMSLPPERIGIVNVWGKGFALLTQT